MERLVVRQGLQGDLGVGLRVKLNEYRREVFGIAVFMLLLQGINLFGDLAELGSKPTDGVDLLSKESKQPNTVRRPSNIRSPHWRVHLVANGGLQVNVSSFENFQTRGICSTDILSLGTLQLVRQLISSVDFLLELSAIRCDPHSADGVTEHLAKLIFILVVLGNRHEENRS